MTINPLEYTVPQPLLDFFRAQAEQKIEVEGWGKQGRNVAVKIDNFVHCWTTEEAFKQVLIKNKIWFRHRGLYFGDSAGAGADFTVRMDGKETTIGLRSIAPDSLTRWRSVPYPDDRFQHEQDKIADYHIVCNHADGLTRFYGIISKAELIRALGTSPRIYSRKNQEHFRVIPLDKFKLTELYQLLQRMERV